MSLRALRKLKGDSDIIAPELREKLSDDETSSAAEDLETTQTQKSKTPAIVNPFDLVC